jgi:hypothetical protein
MATIKGKTTKDDIKKPTMSRYNKYVVDIKKPMNEEIHT